MDRLDILCSNIPKLLNLFSLSKDGLPQSVFMLGAECESRRLFNIASIKRLNGGKL